MFGNNDFMLDTFYRRLTDLRNQKGVSAREMSLALGQSSGYISNIENGNNYPAMATFFYICDYLGVTPCEFFEVENNDPATLSPIFEQIKKLKPEQVEVLQAMLNQMK